MEVDNIQFSLLNKKCILSIHNLKPASFISIFYYGSSIFCIAITIEQGENNEEIDTTKRIRTIYQERAYASKEVPNSRSKREIASEIDTLIARAVDRAIRSTFTHISNKIELNITLINNKKEDDISVGCILGASIAMKILLNKLITICWPTSITVSNDGALSINTYYDYNDRDTSRVLYTFTTDEECKNIYINMIEATAKPSIRPEHLTQMIERFINKAKEDIKSIILSINNYIEKTAKTKYYNTTIKQIEYETCENLANDVHDILENNFNNPTVHSSKVQKHCMDHLSKKYTFKHQNTNITKLVLEKAMRNTIYKLYKDKNYRIDGRKFTQQRPITYKSNFLPDVHDSILISRGEGDTTLLCTMTINTDSRKSIEFKKRPITAHYNLNNFAVNEPTKIFHPRRRDIGHGHIIESSLYSIIQYKDIQTSEVRIVVDVISADGSTSVTGAIGASKITQKLRKKRDKTLSGISIGGFMHDNNVLLLVDINTIEDQYGLFDVKVIVDQHKNIVYIQLDSKKPVINTKLLKRILTTVHNATGDETDSNCKITNDINRRHKLHHLLNKKDTTELPDDFKTNESKLTALKREIKKITTELTYKVKISTNKDSIEIYATNQQDLELAKNRIDQKIKILKTTK